jgi:hypothetical protein
MSERLGQLKEHIALVGGLGNESDDVQIEARAVLSAAVAKKPKTRKKRKKQEVVVVDDDDGDSDNGDDDDDDGDGDNTGNKDRGAPPLAQRDEPTAIIRVCCRRCDRHRCSTHEANNPGK